MYLMLRRQPRPFGAVSIYDHASIRWSRVTNTPKESWAGATFRCVRISPCVGIGPWSAAPSASVGTAAAALNGAAFNQRRLSRATTTGQAGGKISPAPSLPRPHRSWPVVLRAVRAWLEPWIMLWRYWSAWSNMPPPHQLQALLDRLWRGTASPSISRHDPSQQTTGNEREL